MKLNFIFNFSSLILNFITKYKFFFLSESSSGGWLNEFLPIRTIQTVTGYFIEQVCFRRLQAQIYITICCCVKNYLEKVGGEKFDKNKILHDGIKPKD